LAELSSFGEWLRHQRKALDLTQEQLAQQISCSTSALRKIEAEQRRPSEQIVEQLADLFHIASNQRASFLKFARGNWEAAPVGDMEKDGPWLAPHSNQYKPESVNPSLPSGTVTFLFTDIEGSTLLSQMQPEAMQNALVRHHAILRAAIESNHGHVFQIVGDSCSAAFDNALHALNTALDAQRRLRDEPWGEMKPICVRMGLHTGVVNISEGSLERPYSGYSTIAFAQRIMSAAHGGQILLSGVTRELLNGLLPSEVILRDMGEHRLKDLLNLIHLYQVVTADLPADFPALKTLDSFPNNLPIQLTSFIGRERELVEVRRLLSNTRLLTLTGPGGTGKTRLALRMAEELLPSFADGIWLAESAPLTDTSFIPPTIAEIFGLRELPNRPILNVVTDYLRAKQLLLILDNCEHLIEGCAKLSDHLLRSCPRLKIIASSREALGIAGETAYRVPSLSLPDPAQVTREALMEAESVRLFVERASAADPKFDLTNENASDVAQICRRLDGIPLALELAAARLRVFSTEEIAARLDDRFSLLTGGSRAALERHQTLRALIDWSYDLLSKDERRLFRHLSVFAGSWTFEAAEAVCSVPLSRGESPTGVLREEVGSEGLDFLNLLTHLVDKSLVMADTNTQERSTRYHLLETIRQYAVEKLLEAGESRQARARHMDFFLKFAEAAQPHLNGPEDLEWLSRLEMEYDNLRAALEWATQNDILRALRLGTALDQFWNRHGYHVEGRRFLLEALARLQELPPVEGEAADQRISLQARALNVFGALGFGVGDLVGSLKIFEESTGLSRQIGEKSTLAQALSTLGYARTFVGDAEGSYRAAEEGLTLAREVGDKVLLARALRNMVSAIVVTHGDPKAAQAYAEEGLQLLREAGARWDLAMALFHMGSSATKQGNYAEARSRFEACLPLFSELRDRHHGNGVTSELAHLERQQGHFAQAKVLYRVTLLEWQRLGFRAAIAHELECLAMIAKAQEEDQRAAILFGAAEILRETIGISMTSFERVEYEREVNDLRLNMDKVIFTRAWAHGRTLTMEDAIEYGLSVASE